MAVIGRDSELVRRVEDDYGPQLNITIWFLTGVSAVFLGLRVYCKIWRNRSVWWDDYLLGLSWAALAVSTALQSVCVSMGFGKHNNGIDEKEFSRLLLISNAAGFATILAACWSKTSFAMTLMRITQGWTKAFVWFVIITINLTLAMTATIQWAQCYPVEKIWTKMANGKCMSKMLIIQLNTFAAAYSGAMDVALALLPWKVIWHVSINKKEKIGALFAMSMGVFAGVTSFLKIPTISAIASDDIIYSVNLLIFGTAEGAITIMAASIPILRALLQPARILHPPRNLDNYITVDLPEEPQPITTQESKEFRDSSSTRRGSE